MAQLARASVHPGRLRVRVSPSLLVKTSVVAGLFVINSYERKGISMIRPKIGLDWDDVTAPFNSIAIDMANKKYNITHLALDDIDSWENTGRASVIKEFYRDNTLYGRSLQKRQSG